MAVFNTPRGRKLKPVPKARAKAKKPAKPKRPSTPKPPRISPLDAQVLAATALQYGEADRALAGQRAVHQQQAAALPGYFQQYQDALRQATQVTAGAYGNAAAIQQNAANTTSVLDAQQQAALTGQMQTDAASRGATVDPSIAAQMQQAAMARRGTADAFTGLTGTLGAAETSFRANRQVVGAGQRLTAQQDEARRGLAIEGEQARIGREKGAFAVTTKQKLQDAAHQRELENKAFGLNVAKVELDAQKAAQAAKDRRAARITSNRNVDQSRAIAQRRADIAARADARAAAKDAHQRRNKLGPYAPPGSKARNQKDAYGNTPAQRRSAQDALDRAKLLIGGIGVPKGTTVEKAAQILVGEGISALNARAAAELKIHGKLSGKTAAELKRRGAKVDSGKPKAKARK